MIVECAAILVLDFPVCGCMFGRGHVPSDLVLPLRLFVCAKAIPGTSVSSVFQRVIVVVAVHNTVDVASYRLCFNHCSPHPHVRVELHGLACFSLSRRRCRRCHRLASAFHVPSHRSPHHPTLPRAIPPRPGPSRPALSRQPSIL